MERLQKVMAERGVASRRKCEQLILAGQVKVNGQTISELGTKVDPQTALIEVNGKKYKVEKNNTYVLFNKPMGTITSVTDPHGRPVILDYITDINERIYPIGRLDYETEGLLLLTNDGELTYRLSHPSFEIAKTYRAHVRGLPEDVKLNKLRQGIHLDDGMTQPAKVKLLEKTKSGDSWLQLIIHEGKNRQVRRMCAAIGHPVIYLERTHFGFLTLDGVTRGNYRHLTQTEVKKLKSLVKL